MPLRARTMRPSKLSCENGCRLGRSLHLDDATRAGHDEVRVGIGGGVFGVVEVEDWGAAIEAARDGGDLVAQDAVLHHVAHLHPLDAVVERDPGAGDGCRARATIGLNDIAIDGNLAFAEFLQIDHGAECAADETLDFLRAAGRMARRDFAAGAFGRGAGQHGVFRRYPPAALTLQPRRHPFFEAGHAEDVGVAELDQARPLRVHRDCPFDGDPAEFVGLAFGGAHEWSIPYDVGNSARP